MKQTNQRGFTIIELLIATVIFSVLLLTVAGAIVQFNKIYYKGTITNRTNERTRVIVEDIAKSAQFSNGAVPTDYDAATNTGVICAGNRQYTFRKNVKVTPSPSGSRGIVARDVTNCSPDSPYADMDASAPLEAGAVELLGENMVVRDISVTDATDTVDIYVWITYGDDGDLSDDQKSCKSSLLGGQFCAVSEIRTTVYPRIRNL